MRTMWICDRSCLTDKAPLFDDGSHVFVLLTFLCCVVSSMLVFFLFMPGFCLGWVF